MPYDPKTPPALLANGIGGAVGLRHYGYRNTTDTVAQVLAAGYFTNARKIGMRAGDALRFVDGNGDSHHLQVTAIDEDTGAGTVAFPAVAPEAIPEDDLQEPLTDYPATIVAFQGGRQIQIPLEQGATAIIPVPTEEEAETGEDNFKRMTPLRTRQYVEGGLFTPALAGAAEGQLRRALDFIPGLHLFKADAAASDGDALRALASYDAGDGFGYPDNREMSFNAVSSGMFIPPGRYVFDGDPIVQTAIRNLTLWAIPGTVSIELDIDDYLFQPSNQILNAYIKGIRTVGGKGLLKQTHTTSDVAGMRIIEDCYFDGYTECAITNSGNDSPYWKLVRNMYEGAVGYDTIGFALGGYLDSSVFESQEFIRNKYHMKIGDRLSGNIAIRECSFLSFDDNNTEADIWIVPNTTESGGTNAGSPLLIDANKFGNEGFNESKPRILVANEDMGSGDGRWNRTPSTTWAETGAYVNGLRFSNNRISANANAESPFIKSYINNLIRLRWEPNNTFDGGAHTYLCEFSAPVASEDAYVTRSWDVEFGGDSQAVAGYRAFRDGIANRPVGVVRDPAGAMAGETSTIRHGMGNANRKVLAKATGASGLSNGTGVSKTNVTDALGNASRAGEFTLGGTGNGNGISVRFNSIDTPEANRLTWLDFDLGPAASRGVERVRVQIINTNNNKYALNKVVKVPASWQTISLPFSMPDAADMTAWYFRLIADDYTAGVADRFQLGRLRVYQGRAPENGGHIETLGDGLWNGERLIFPGGEHLWLDSSRRIRGKNGAPTSESDGYQLSRRLNTAPSTATDPGVLGDWAVDGSYLYACIGTNTWKRVAISSW